MDDLRLGAIESRFADIIWDNAPLGSGELVKLAAQELGWKKSTTYTELKKRGERGLFRNEGGTVSVQLTREEFHAMQSERFLDETFSGSLPAFIAAFSTRKKLSEEELRELEELIRRSRG